MVISLYDQQLTLLHTFGSLSCLFDNTILQQDKNLIGHLFLERTDCSLDKTGLTALDAVIDTNKPSISRGTDHQNILRTISCYAVPIRDQNGYLIGVLAGWFPSSDHKAFVPAIITAAAAMLESRVTANGNFISLPQLISFLTHSTDGFLVLNGDGVVTQLNQAACDIIGLDPLSIGQKIKDLVSFEPQLLVALHTGRGWLDRQFVCNMPKGNIHMLKSAIPISDHTNRVVTLLDVICKTQVTYYSFPTHNNNDTSLSSFGSFIYRSRKISELLAICKKVAHKDTTVLIQGETGTGKELLAQALHKESNRCNGPFITIDCSTLPKDLMESELFGYEDGTFTGARKGGKLGKFEMANDGTIFLDEIGEVPIDLQAKFLRVLQTKAITRIGSTKIISLNIRIVAATNVNLAEAVGKGIFREDLYYRLNIIPIVVPPLRERKEDILPLLTHFIKRRRNAEISISDDASTILTDYAWPGNVRELENAIEYALEMADDSVILPEHLPPWLKVVTHKVKNNFHSHLTFGQTSIKQKPSLHNDDINMELDSLDTIRDAERKAISKVLIVTNGNKSQAAKLLGIARSTLKQKMKQYGLYLDINLGK